MLFWISKLSFMTSSYFANELKNFERDTKKSFEARKFLKF